MTTPEAPRAGDQPAVQAIAAFARHLARSGAAPATIRVRRHFLHELLHHIRGTAGTATVTVADLTDPGRVAAWLADAQAGQTRTRNTLGGRRAAARANSMRARVASVNSFSEFSGGTERITTQPAEPGPALSAGEARELLHQLAIRRPLHANAATSLRTAAMAAMVAATGRGVADLAGLTLRDIDLGDAPRVTVRGEHYPLDDEAVLVLRRWLGARAEITAALQGSDPGHLWIPTKPGRPRGGREPVKPGLERAAVRTLHAAHRSLVGQLLGTQVRPGTLRALHEEPATA